MQHTEIQNQKAVCSVMLWKRHSYNDGEEMSGCQVGGCDHKGKEWGSLWVDVTVLYLDCGSGYKNAYIYENSTGILTLSEF